MLLTSSWSQLFTYHKGLLGKKVEALDDIDESLQYILGSRGLDCEEEMRWKIIRDTRERKGDLSPPEINYEERTLTSCSSLYYKYMSIDCHHMMSQIRHYKAMVGYGFFFFFK